MSGMRVHSWKYCEQSAHNYRVKSCTEFFCDQIMTESEDRQKAINTITSARQNSSNAVLVTTSFTRDAARSVQWNRSISREVKTCTMTAWWHQRTLNILTAFTGGVLCCWVGTDASSLTRLWLSGRLRWHSLSNLNWLWKQQQQHQYFNQELLPFDWLSKPDAVQHKWDRVGNCNHFTLWQDSNL